MRVVAGRFKGRTLRAPRSSTRPTLDRVREALFSMLGPLDGERVLDLYAGSGALGIEALSRGAAEPTFVDSDAAAVRAVRENLRRALGSADAPRENGEVKVVRADALAFLRSAARQGRYWDLVFCDPPYRLAARLGEPLSRMLEPVLAPGARVVCESAHRQPLELGLPLVQERRYGDTRVAIYRAPEQEAVSMSLDGTTAICPGSYDPVTYGHLDIIERAARVFNRVIVGVVNQPVRKAKTLFSAEERRDFLLQATDKLENVEVDVFDTLLVDFARKHGAGALVKGLRAISDFEYEFEMNQLNRKLAADIESVYMMASPEFSFLSSSGIKELATFGADISDLAPTYVASALHDRLSRDRE